jgi:uncharacterized protein (UPF0332 family)
MPEKLMQRLLKEGKLKKQEVGIVQVEQLLSQSLRDLREASKIRSIAETATYIMAYNGMLKAGRALLLLNGLLPDDGAQHRTVVEVTAAILGEKYKRITAHFEIMRKKRNELTYEAGTIVSATESKLAFDDAIELVKGILRKAKSQNPQLELKFEI